ncbi:hypothetical protein ASF61_02390 [Duganella sp. Leaf126]|uniref:hypothetical protein n=1 Tax=Duganella sp. Leaf126 TaxID=1736266 RepID=UPI0006FFF07F|nr:hypothetical protein [Duganella sp. Leaf126]KQQ47507.1 hypothetical protein ASF61_02390 [Duganella sp. Leaf126]
MLKQADINTDDKLKDDGKPRMPHERDESPEGRQPAERSIMKQAAADVDSGMVDTDLRNKPGVEKVKTPAPREATAKPLPDTKQD